MTGLRCAARSLSRGEPVLGTASTVTAYLLVEYAGAWGEDALRDSRLPEEVKTHLRETSRDLGIKVLLIRRHTRQREGTVVCRVFAAYAEPHSPWMETTSLGTHEDILDLDLAPLSRRGGGEAGPPQRRAALERPATPQRSAPPRPGIATDAGAPHHALTNAVSGRGSSR